MDATNPSNEDPTSKYKDETFRSPKDPLQVHMFLKLYTLTDIDTNNQRFTTRALLTNKHVLTRLQFKDYLECKEKGEDWKFDHQWMWPYNALEVEYEERFGQPAGETQEWFVGLMGGQAVSYVQRFAKITWNVDFHLRNFPFDNHHLPIVLDYGGPRTLIDLDCSFSHYLVRPDGQWEIAEKLLKFPENDYVVCSKGYIGDGFDVSDETKALNETDPATLAESQLCQEYLQAAYTMVVIPISRNWSFFLWRVYFVLFIVTILSICVFLFDSIGDQFGFLSTTLLTTVAYLYYIGSFLPVMKYNTLMDWYIYALILFKFCIGAAVVVIHFVRKSQTEEYMQQFQLAVTTRFFVVFFAAHVLYCMVVFRCVQKAKLPTDKIRLNKPLSELLEQKCQRKT